MENGNKYISCMPQTPFNFSSSFQHHRVFQLWSCRGIKDTHHRRQGKDGGFIGALLCLQDTSFQSIMWSATIVSSLWLLRFPFYLPINEDLIHGEPWSTYCQLSQTVSVVKTLFLQQAILPKTIIQTGRVFCFSCVVMTTMETSFLLQMFYCLSLLSLQK